VAGGTITGRYVVQAAPSAAAHGLGHRLIGLFASRSSRREDMRSGAPLATTWTRPDGRFAFVGVSTGSWMVASAGSVSPWHAESRLVRVTRSTGARVRLVACLECFPGPDASH
jgi:hypothetical protein